MNGARIVRSVTLRDIAADLFAPYGELLESPGNAARLDHAAEIANHRPAARANLAVVRAEPAPVRLEITELERHPWSSQAFIPIDVEQYLVVVARDDGGGRPDLATLAAFRVSGRQGISYRAGIWHFGMTTLKRSGIFAMLVHEDGSTDDCHFQAVEPFEVRR